MITVPEIGHAMFRFPHEDLYVCTTCFQLTALVQDWARCACEPAIELDDPLTFDPTVALLCVLCARGAVRKGQPYWWQGCPSCLEFNGQNELALKQMNRTIDKWTPEWESLFQWGRALARELWETVPEWADDKYIGVKAWEAKFPNQLMDSQRRSTKVSCQGYLVP